MALVDPTSDTVLFRYTGPDGEIERPDGSILQLARGAAGSPARDLTEADVARLAYRRSLDEVLDRVGQPSDPGDPDSPPITRPDPRKPDPKHVEAITAEIVASGRFTPAKATKADQKKTDTPATPAPIQEG